MLLCRAVRVLCRAVWVLWQSGSGAPQSGSGAPQGGLGALQSSMGARVLCCDPWHACYPSLARTTMSYRSASAEADIAQTERLRKVAGFLKGTRVLISGLVARPELNGTCGTILSFIASDSSGTYLLNTALGLSLSHTSLFRQ